MKCFWIGEGKTKQAAKRQAAYIMYEQIQNVPQPSKEHEYPVPSKFMLNTRKINDFEYKNDTQSVEVFFNQLKRSQNPSLNKLRVIHQFNLSMLNIYIYFFYYLYAEYRLFSWNKKIFHWHFECDR